jgi:predicted deacetylase
MSNLNTFSNLLEEVGTTLSLFIAMRDQMSDDEWNTLNDHPLLSPLLDSLSDLEYTVGP